MRTPADTVYLVHFAPPIGNTTNPHGTAQHSIGWTTNLPERLALHQAGAGAKLMAAVARGAIPWTVVRTWPGTRADERKLKNRKQAKTLCPVCQADHAR